MWFLNLTLRNRRVAALLAIFLVAVIGYEYWRWHPRHGSVSFFPQYSIALKDYDGRTVKLSSFKREPIVVHAWASWCVYCSGELKQLAQLKQKYGNRIEIVAPNRAESRYDAKQFTDSLGLGNSITYLLDPDDAFYKSIGGYAMPETLFVDDRGEVVLHQRGPMSMDAADAAIEQMLK